MLKLAVGLRVEGTRQYVPNAHHPQVVSEGSRYIAGAVVAQQAGQVRYWKSVHARPVHSILDHLYEGVGGSCPTFAGCQHFIRPGKPVENAFAESFNGRLRDECLNINWFMTIKHAREVIEIWRRDYNEVRPHSSLKGRSPKEYAEAVAALY